MTERTAGSGPFVSVVITCFNYARYVGGAIESALAQDYAASEVVAVNDGSTDGSLDVIARYAPRIRILDQKNEGWVAAYNRGFSASRGDVVIFLDADDLLLPGALSAVSRAWSPSCTKVQYDLSIIDAEGADLGRRFCSFPAEYDATRIREAFRTTGTYVWPVTVGNAYSRWFVDAVFPLEHHGPDGLLNTLAPLYGDVVTIPRPLGAYRLHGGNGWSSSGSDLDRLPERIRHRRSEIAILREHAHRRGVTLPRGDILDNELVFVNYRLMAWRSGLSYPGKAEDTARRLFCRALRLVSSDAYTPRAALAHRAWFCALMMAPPPVARELIRFRFERARWKGDVRRKVREVRERLSRSDAR